MESFENEATYRKFLTENREDEFDRLFNDAVKTTEASILGKEFPIYINGEPRTSKDKLVERSPINGIIIGTFQKGDRTLAKEAIDAADNAFESWSSLDYKKRASIFEKAADILSKEKFLVSAIMSIENGKTRYESVGEVDEGIDFLRYYSYLMLKNRGYVTKNSFKAADKQTKNPGFQGAPGRTEKVKIEMKPYGAFGVIAPFNFPISISIGMSTGALITGNTVVFKPSSSSNMTMLTGLKIFEILRDAGLPAGAFNYITGPGSEIGQEFVNNPKIKGIAFTGSRAVGMSMIKASYEAGSQKVFVVEMGGKNPVIVSKHADLDIATKGIISSAFGYCGQKCSAASRLLIDETIKDALLAKLTAYAKKLRIGNPLLKEVYLGPLISADAVNKYDYALDEIKRMGKVLCGGHRVKNGLSDLYVEPTIAQIEKGNKLLKEELFVPILLISTYKRFDDAIKMANDVDYGLTAGVYSQEHSEIKRFFEKVESGVMYSNREIGATTGAIVGVHSFVGWKGSGLTGKGTGSKYYLEQFMHEKSESMTI